MDLIVSFYREVPVYFFRNAFAITLHKIADWVDPGDPFKKGAKC